MRELVDERDLRLARQHRVDVHLLERAAAVGHDAAGNDLQTREELGGQLPVISLGKADDDVRAAREPAVALTEHRVRLSHPGRRAKVDAQLTAPHAIRDAPLRGYGCPAPVKVFAPLQLPRRGGAGAAGTPPNRGRV